MFKIINDKKKELNPFIMLPNFDKEEWLEEKDMAQLLYLYTFIIINQLHINGNYIFSVYEYLTLNYTESYIKNYFCKSIKKDINNCFQKLKDYKLLNINNTNFVKNKNDILYFDSSDIINSFENGYYTLIDYNIIQKIFSTKININKPKLLYCCLFLNNRARDTVGYTSYEDIGQVLGSNNTIKKYLDWFKDNEIFDYYSTNCKLDEIGRLKKGNTLVVKWENSDLLDSTRANDKPITASKKDINVLNERFKDDKWYKKMPKMLNENYGFTNNFVLLRLYNQLEYGFTWHCIYSYLNNNANVDFFNTNDDYMEKMTQLQIINKIVNMAKTQENSVLGYCDEYNEGILNPDDSNLLGKYYEKNKYKIAENIIEARKKRHVDNLLAYENVKKRKTEILK